MRRARFRSAERVVASEARSSDEVILARLGRTLAIAALLFGVGDFALNRLAGQAFVESWQSLVVAAIAVLCAGSFFGASILAETRPGLGRGLLIATALLFYPAVSLLWVGGSPVLGLGTVILGGLLAFALLPDRPSVWLWVLILVIGLTTATMDSASLPWTRFDLDSVASVTAASRVLTVAVVAIVLVQVIRTLRLAGIATSIRTRLTVTFIALTLGVAIVTSVTGLILGIRTTRAQAYEKLEVGMALRAQAIDAWVDQRIFALDTVVVPGDGERLVHDLLMATAVEDPTSVTQALRARFNDLTQGGQWFSEISLVDTNGTVVMSSKPALEGSSVSQMPYFAPGLVETYVDTPRYDPEYGMAMVAMALPLTTGDAVYGMLVGRADISELVQAMAPTSLGQSGHAFLVGTAGATGAYVVLTEHTLAGGQVPVNSPAISAAMALRQTATPQARGLEAGEGMPYVDHKGIQVVGVYGWLPRLQVAMVVEIERAQLLAQTRATTVFTAAAAILSSVVAVVVALYLSRNITDALSNLAATATAIASGDLAREARVLRDDETGVLARAFNAMTAQLRTSITNLERRVQERTRGLEAVTEVSRVTTSVLDLDRLLPQVVDMVRDGFDLYYVGLFLVNEEEDDAVLRAGTGEAGRAMLAQGWRLPLDGTSMVGRCVTTREATVYVAKAATAQASGRGRLINPLLPDTRAELALPLRYGGRVVGAMTVQSVDREAFPEEAISVLQTLADQVAVAVQNARSFAETQEALARANRVQARYQAEAWSEYLQGRPVAGYELRGSRVVPLGEAEAAAAAGMFGQPGSAANGGNGGDDTVLEDGVLFVPVRQSGQLVGVVGVEREGEWTPEDRTMVASLVEQLALAAENQRLLDDISHRAALEQTISQVTGQVRSELEIEDVIERTLTELARLLDADEGMAVLTLDADTSRSADPARPAGGTSGHRGNGA